MSQAIDLQVSFAGNVASSALNFLVESGFLTRKYGFCRQKLV